MKITRMPDELYLGLEDIWTDNAPEMPDVLRDVSNLQFLLFDDGGGSQWYILDEDDKDIVFFLTNIVPGLSATFYGLNLKDASIPKAREQLKEIMREFDLRRLTYTIPAPVVELARIAQSLGFWPEGRAKEAAIYNGEYTDMDWFGFYRSEVEDAKVALSGPAAVGLDKPKKRRRRSRRKKKTAPKESA
jgi:hypothetical protein